MTMVCCPAVVFAGILTVARTVPVASACVVPRDTGSLKSVMLAVVLGANPAAVTVTAPPGGTVEDPRTVACVCVVAVVVVVVDDGFDVVEVDEGPVVVVAAGGAVVVLVGCSVVDVS